LAFGLDFGAFSAILSVEAPDDLPTPQGGAQTPGYFFVRSIPTQFFRFQS
jgi:hypothetical protein